MRLRTVIGPPYLPSRSSKWSAAAEKYGSTMVTARLLGQHVPSRQRREGTHARSAALGSC